MSQLVHVPTLCTPDDTSLLGLNTVRFRKHCQYSEYVQSTATLRRMSHCPLLAVAPGSVVSSALATSARQNARAADVGAPTEILFEDLSFGRAKFRGAYRCQGDLQAGRRAEGSLLWKAESLPLAPGDRQLWPQVPRPALLRFSRAPNVG